eukprot:2661619-Alexandrium_andersonii.AAC.1
MPRRRPALVVSPCSGRVAVIGKPGEFEQGVEEVVCGRCRDHHSSIMGWRRPPAAAGSLSSDEAVVQGDMPHIPSARALPGARLPAGRSCVTAPTPSRGGHTSAQSMATAPRRA